MWDLLFTGPVLWFSIPALLGTAFFALKLVLMLAGGDHDSAADGHDAGIDHADADFKLLSVQSALAFLMGFGWTGMLVYSLKPSQLILAAAVGLAAGTVAMYLMARALAALMKLQSSGNVDPRSAVGTIGTVYVGIPGGQGGMGQVTLVIDQKQRTYNAVTGGDAIARESRVRVVGIQGQNTLAVEPA